MTKSMSASCARREETTSRVLTSWMDEMGICVSDRASEMTFEIATNDSVDSLPPINRSKHISVLNDG
jgi:hypothetical protein